MIEMENRLIKSTRKFQWLVEAIILTEKKIYYVAGDVGATYA